MGTYDLPGKVKSEVNRESRRRLLASDLPEDEIFERHGRLLQEAAVVEDTADAGTEEQSDDTGESGDAGDSGDASAEEVSDASVEVVEVPDASTEADAAE